MPTELAFRYQRLVEDPQLARLWTGVCWTVVEPVSAPADVDEVIRRLGGDPRQTSTQPVDHGDFGNGSCVLYLDQVGRAVSMFEVGGYQGSRPEVLRVLSDGARVHSAFWNVHTAGEFSYAVYGRTLVSFSATSPYDRDGEDPDVMNRDLVDIFEARPDNDEPDGNGRAALLATIERRTGVRLDSAWLRRPLRRIALAPLPRDPVPPPNAVYDFDLDAAYRLAAEPAQRAARAWLLRRLAEDFGFAGNQDVADGIARVASGQPVDPFTVAMSRLSELPADSPARLLRGKEFEAHPDRRRSHAGSAIVRLLEPTRQYDPYRELYGLLNARFAYADRWPGLRDGMREQLTQRTDLGQAG